MTSGTPQRSAHRSRSRALWAAFDGERVAKSFCGVPLAAKTPPRSIGL